MEASVDLMRMNAFLVIYLVCFVLTSSLYIIDVAAAIPTCQFLVPLPFFIA